MDRLLVIKLDTLDCEAELWFNGIPLARADAARSRIVLPVHEYTVAGDNRVELIVWPHAPTTPHDAVPEPLPLTTNGRQMAAVHVLLPRVGSPADEGSARSLAQLSWAPAAGEAYTAPHRLAQDVALPVSFPRWRWLDAPVLRGPAELAELHASALAFVQACATDLAAGEVDRFLAATRLRTEELALAYLRQPADELARLRERLLKWHADGRLVWPAFESEGLVLRPIAGGRLADCLGLDGQPVLKSLPDAHGRVLALPLRLAAVEGKLYVLR